MLGAHLCITTLRMASYTRLFLSLVLAFVAGTKTSLPGRVGEILMAPWVAGVWGWVNRFWVTIPLIMRGFC